MYIYIHLPSVHFMYLFRKYTQATCIRLLLTFSLFYFSIFSPFFLALSALSLSSCETYIIEFPIHQYFACAAFFIHNCKSRTYQSLHPETQYFVSFAQGIHRVYNNSVLLYLHLMNILSNAQNRIIGRGCVYTTNDAFGIHFQVSIHEIFLCKYSEARKFDSYFCSSSLINVSCNREITALSRGKYEYH